MLSFLKTIERPLACGEIVIIKNIGESIDPTPDPLLEGIELKMESKYTSVIRIFP